MSDPPPPGTSGLRKVATEDFPAVIIHAPLPSVVLFSTEWCGTGKMLRHVLETEAGAYSGKVGFAQVDLDEEPGLDQAFGIRAIPALIFFREGAPQELRSGLLSSAELRSWIGLHLDAADRA